MLVIFYILSLLVFVFFTEVGTRVSMRIEYSGCCFHLGQILASKVILKYYIALLLLTSFGIYFMYKRVKLLAIMLGLSALFLIKLVYTDIDKLVSSTKKFERVEWEKDHPVEMAIYIKEKVDLEGLSSQELVKILGEPTEVYQDQQFEIFLYKTDACMSLKLRLIERKVIHCGLSC